MVYLGNLISKNVKNRNKNILDVSHDIASSEKWCEYLDKKVQDFSVVSDSNLPRNQRKTNFLNFKLLRRTAKY
jgi:hypothetical protein